MGKSKYIEKIRSLFEKSPIVDFKSIERVVKSSRKSNYSKLLVSNLLNSGEIKKLAKGYYTIYDDISLSVLCYSPAYLGLQSALSFHGLWEQETIPIILTPRKVKTGRREIMGGNILLRKLKEKYLFGFDYVLDGDFYLPYSDIEKTFIDMIYFRQPLDKDLLNEFRKRINEKKLKKYLRVYGKRLKEKILKIYFNLRDETV